MKSIPYLQESAAVSAFLANVLCSAAFRARFVQAPYETKRALVLHFLIGPETERFAAEPIYGPTGKGYLRSKGVDGILAERALETSLSSPEGEAVVLEFLHRVEAML